MHLVAQGIAFRAEPDVSLAWRGVRTGEWFCNESWLEARQADLLPLDYYHIVFTLPAPISAIAYYNKAVIYDLLFEIAAETLRTIAADPKHLGAQIGVTLVASLSQSITQLSANLVESKEVREVLRALSDRTSSNAQQIARTVTLVEETAGTVSSMRDHIMRPGVVSRLVRAVRRTLGGP
jgi:hypothetical protein